MSVWKEEERIGVHIADVSHFVRPGTALDDEAAFRATSVYLPDRVCLCCPNACPMTSARSSLRCRLAFSVYFDINPKGKIEHIEIARSVINSDCALPIQRPKNVSKEGDETLSSLFNSLTNWPSNTEKNDLMEGQLILIYLKRFKLDRKVILLTSM